MTAINSSLSVASGAAYSRIGSLRPIMAVGALAVLCLGLAGCDVCYIARAAYEEGRLLWNRRPITEELANESLPDGIRRKLETVLQVRDFAADNLDLNVGGSYQTITQVDQGAVVWVLMAAPRDSLTPYEWWFPIVGSVPYRGYFDRPRAEAEAARMEAKGYDTLVRPAVAFSTLGFFNDPLLSNLLELDRVELAGLIIHELFHRTFYLPSDAMFDESAATYIGSRGAVDFFTATQGAGSSDAAAARGVFESDLKFAAFLRQEEALLLDLYMSKLPKQEILKQRGPIFAQISADYARLKPSLSGLERFDLDKTPLNNAVLLNYLLYFHDLDNLAALERVHHGDLKATIKAIIELAKSEPDDPFHAIWKATRNAPRPSVPVAASLALSGAPASQPAGGRRSEAARSPTPAPWQRVPEGQ